MRGALDAFEKYLHEGNDDPDLVRLAFIHYQFEVTHPFVDGNGRVGRMLLPLLLLHWELLPVPLLYLSAFFERHQDEYYQLLIGVSERGAWRAWLTFFLRAVAEQSADTTARAKRLEELQLRWRGKLKDGRAPDWMLALVDVLFERPLVSVRTVLKRLGVPQTAATEGLVWLEDMGILREITGERWDKLYLAAAIINAVE
jgi:Fic family protein